MKIIIKIPPDQEQRITALLGRVPSNLWPFVASVLAVAVLILAWKL
jgi:hypothetical protein